MITEVKYYELSYLIRPALAQEDAARVEEEFRNLLGGLQAAFDSWDSPKRRQLSYPIQKETEAYLGALRFTIAKEHATTIEKAVKKNKDVIRFMLLEWKKSPQRRERRITRPVEQKDEQVPTDEKALDEKLEEIFSQNI